MNKTTTGLIAFVVVGLLAIALLLVILLAARAPGDGKRPASQAAAKSAPGSEDPYPECAAIRKWLPSQLGDPRDMEILEWQSRDVIPETINPLPPRNLSPGFVLINFRIRARNDRGGMSIAIGQARSDGEGKPLHGNIIPQR